MLKVRDNNVIVCCRGDENDDGSGHPIVYLHKEGEMYCPYCNKSIDEIVSAEEFQSVEVKVISKKERTKG
ncbi:zinc-finger domain-containing protein [Wolbachia endosymbiont (group B) of Episyrphus balteatus]|uniref:zinc-finger domain-containing protein n=1 Tax=Wolbachia endosymbiont (group B) of Episyrphus balteatus TaxID=2954009 RepID=UPI0022261C79|nr:zinc-finger domain-containing protein [Wolbachia endosymbiont (group B) of Episyrphus balteatus]